MTGFKRLTLLAALTACAPLWSGSGGRLARTIVAACKLGTSPAPLAGWVARTRPQSPFAEDRCAQGGAFGFTVRTKPAVPGKTWASRGPRWSGDGRRHPTSIEVDLADVADGIDRDPCGVRVHRDRNPNGASFTVDSALAFRDGGGCRDVAN